MRDRYFRVPWRDVRRNRDAGHDGDSAATPELNPAVPPALDAIIARAMAKDAAVRYESARSLHADLRELKHALDGATTAVGATAPSPTKVRGKSIGFKTVIAASAVTVLVAAWFASGVCCGAGTTCRRPLPSVVRPRHERDSRRRVFSGEQVAGAGARTGPEVCPRAGSAGRSLRGDGTHRQGQ